MKLLLETYTDIISEEIITESGKKNLYIQGPFLSYDTPNRNGRIYKKNILLKEAMRFNEEVVKKNKGYCELTHPEGTLTINPDRICARIVELWDDPSQKAIMGKAIITETATGNTVRALLESGGAVGISSRAAGSVRKRPDGLNEVQDDFKLAALDLVLNPSGVNCYVTPLMESKEYDFIDGILVEKKLEVNEKVEQKDQLTESQLLNMFEKLLNTIE